MARESMKWYERPELRFAVGIEDTFIPQTRAGERALDEYELTQHYDYWHSDLGGRGQPADLAAPAQRPGRRRLPGATGQRHRHLPSLRQHRPQVQQWHLTVRRQRRCPQGARHGGQAPIETPLDGDRRPAVARAVSECGVPMPWPDSRHGSVDAGRPRASRSPSPGLPVAGSVSGRRVAAAAIAHPSCDSP
jgi:hypothetical protein